MIEFIIGHLCGWICTFDDEQHLVALYNLEPETSTAQKLPEQDFCMTDTLQQRELSPPNSIPIPGLLSKVRRPAEILKKNYIVITPAFLRGQGGIGSRALDSHNRWPLCPSERDPYHTDHCEGPHKGSGERYFITRVLADQFLLSALCQPPFYTARVNKTKKTQLTSEFGCDLLTQLNVH